MNSPSPKKSADALAKKVRAQKLAVETKVHRILASRPLSDARVRALYYRSQGIQPTTYETALFVRTHQAFIDEIFDCPEIRGRRFSDDGDE